MRCKDKLRGDRTESRRVTKNTIVSVTQRWEQHVYLARLQHVHSFLMKAVLRGRWAKHRDCLIYDVQGLFRCQKWRILLGVLHQILRNIYSLTLLTKGTSPLLQRERSTLQALPKMTEIPKAALYARTKPAISSLYVAQLERVLSRNSQNGCFGAGSDTHAMNCLRTIASAPRSLRKYSCSTLQTPQKATRHRTLQHGMHAAIFQ